MYSCKLQKASPTERLFALSNIDFSGCLTAVDAAIHTEAEVTEGVAGADLNDRTVAAACAYYALNAADCAGGVFVPCKVDRIMDMGADTCAMLLTVADGGKAVVAVAVVAAVALVVTGYPAACIAVALSAHITAEVAAAHKVYAAALILAAVAALVDKYKAAEGAARYLNIGHCQSIALSIIGGHSGCTGTGGMDLGGAVDEGHIGILSLNLFAVLAEDILAERGNIAVSVHREGHLLILEEVPVDGVIVSEAVELIDHVLRNRKSEGRIR